jgi:hypothetical protein
MESIPDLFLRLGGGRQHCDGDCFRIDALDLVALLDQFELLRILDLQADGPGRPAQVTVCFLRSTSCTSAMKATSFAA